MYNFPKMNITGKLKFGKCNIMSYSITKTIIETLMKFWESSGPL